MMQKISAIASSSSSSTIAASSMTPPNQAAAADQSQVYPTPSSVFYAQSPRDSSASASTVTATPDHPIYRSSSSSNDQIGDLIITTNSNSNSNSNRNSNCNCHGVGSQRRHSINQAPNLNAGLLSNVIPSPLSSAPSSPLFNLLYHNAVGEPLHKFSTSDHTFHFLNHPNSSTHTGSNAIDSRRSNYIKIDLPPSPDPSLASSGMMSNSSNRSQKILGPYNNYCNNKWESVDEEDEEDCDHHHHGLLFNHSSSSSSSSCNQTIGCGNTKNNSNNRRITRNILFFWCRVYTIAAISMLLFVFLVLWLACTPHGSIVTVEDIEFLEFTLVHGSDRSQVPTDMLLVDSNVTLSFHNPSRYFHIEFSPTLLALSYLGVPIAHGKMPPFELNHGSMQPMLVKMESNEAPLYGAGIGFEASGNEVNVHLKVSINMQVHILQNFLRRQFLQDLSCAVKIDRTTQKVFHLTCI